MFPSVVSAGTVFTPGSPGSETAETIGVATLMILLTILFTACYYSGPIIDKRPLIMYRRSLTRRAINILLSLLFVYTIASVTILLICVYFCVPGESFVEGDVSKVASTSDGPVVVFDDGKSVLAAGYIDELKDLAGLRVKFSCDSKGAKADSFESINRCEYDKIVSGPGSKHNSN